MAEQQLPLCEVRRVRDAQDAGVDVDVGVPGSRRPPPGQNGRKSSAVGTTRVARFVLYSFCLLACWLFALEK